MIQQKKRALTSQVKKYVITMAMSALLMMPTFAQAYHVLTGTIHRLDTNDETLTAASEGGGSKLRLANTNLSAGSCHIDPEGYLVIWIRDNSMGERMFTTLLAAQLAGHPVTVTVDDTLKNSEGVCFANQVRLGLDQ